MIRGRRREEWERSFHSAPWVSYVEALGWIYFRDVQAIGEVGIVSSEIDYAEMGSATASGLLSMEVPAEDWRAAAPALALRDALEGGQVSACAKVSISVPSVSGERRPIVVTARRMIEADEWLDFEFRDAPSPNDKGTAAYPKGHIPGADASHILIDIMFARADLTSVFPGHGANRVVSLATSQSDNPSWHPKTGEYAEAWVSRPDVLAEARRILVSGVSQKTGLPGVLYEMQLSARGWRQSTIRNAVTSAGVSH